MYWPLSPQNFGSSNTLQLPVSRRAEPIQNEKTQKADRHSTKLPVSEHTELKLDLRPYFGFIPPRMAPAAVAP